MARTALVIVDVQNDFCPGGSLAVPNGDRVLAPLNRVAMHVVAAGGLVIASRDWHPPRTTHFAEFGGAWPVHCIRETDGAAFHPDLRLPADTIVVSKGTGPEEDAYSAFDATAPSGEGLADLLRLARITRLLVGGLATDYCVRATALDALKRGFAVTVLTDAVAGVNLQPGDDMRALEEMRAAGAVLAVSTELGVPPTLSP